MFAAAFFRETALALATAFCVASGAAAAPPTRAVAEEVRFQSEPGVILSGTLEKPAAARKPMPIVLLVPGAGRWPRGGFPGIRARLLADGIATFQFDKRGVGQSSGAFDESLPVIARDVAAAVAFLRTRSSLDMSRLGLLGHSQGAAALPLVSSRDPAIAALVMLAGPVGPRGGLFLGIMRENLAAAGTTAAEIDGIADAVARWMEARSRRAEAAEIARQRAAAVAAFAGGGFGGEKSEAAVPTLDTPVILSMYEVSIDEALSRTRARVLAVYGSRDPVIAPAFSIPEAQAALRNNPDAMVIAVPGLGHNLQRVDDGDSAPMAPAVVELVADWLRNRLRPPRERR